MLLSPLALLCLILLLKIKYFKLQGFGMYLIEGNIGAGKTTFLQLMQKQMPQLNVALEPVNVWQNNDHGKSLLQNFYSNTERWAYTMESFTLINRTYENSKLINSALATLAERSIYSGYYCFAKNSYLTGFMSKLEWDIYQEWFSFLTSHHNYPKPSGFIYLRTTPSTAYNRVIKRNRLAENLISFDYINQIHMRHEELLLNHNQKQTNIIANIPVLVLDANSDFESNPQDLAILQKQIAAFISTSQRSQSPENQTLIL
jgi:deoxycitidine kinase